MFFTIVIKNHRLGKVLKFCGKVFLQDHKSVFLNKILYRFFFKISLSILMTIFILLSNLLLVIEYINFIYSVKKKKSIKIKRIMTIIRNLVN